MQDNQKIQLEKDLKVWIKQHLDAAVQELMDRGIFDSVIVEAKPAWSFPFGILIFKIRQQGHAGGFDWAICGSCPTDYVHSSLAATPREAARHFALKWQLEASRQTEEAIQAATATITSTRDLTKMAESLYELVMQDDLWLK